MAEPASKVFVSATELNRSSVRLARQVWASGFDPDVLVGLWRGGTPPAIIVHEFLRLRGATPYHTTVKTQSYQGLQRTGQGVEVTGLQHVVDRVDRTDRVLLVDDVFDTGHTIAAIVSALQQRCGTRCPEIRTGTVYFKPLRNQTMMVPDYFAIETDDWIVFPHELEGLTDGEIAAKGGVGSVVLGEREGAAAP